MHPINLMQNMQTWESVQIIYHQVGSAQGVIDAIIGGHSCTLAALLGHQEE